MPTIGERTRGVMVAQVRGLLEDYAEEIEEAYCNHPDAMKIALNVTLKPDGSKTNVKTKLSFVNSKTEAELTQSVDERQLSLFDESGKVSFPFMVYPYEMDGRIVCSFCGMEPQGRRGTGSILEEADGDGVHGVLSCTAEACVSKMELFRRLYGLGTSLQLPLGSPRKAEGPVFGKAA